MHRDASVSEHDIHAPEALFGGGEEGELGGVAAGVAVLEDDACVGGVELGCDLSAEGGVDVAEDDEGAVAWWDGGG